MTEQQQTTLFLELTIDNQLIRVPISPATKITLSFSTGTGSPQVESPPVPVIPPKPLSLFENSQEKPIPDQPVQVKQELGLQEDLPAATKGSPILPKAYSRFQSQCDQLFQAGFTEIQKNISVLRQCNGDFNAALQILKRTSQELSNQLEETNPSSGENSLEEPKISPTGSSSNNLFDSQKLSQESDLLSKQPDAPKSGEASPEAVPTPDYSHEVEALVQKGFCNRKQNLKLLQKFGGNIAQVENFLNSKRKQLPEKFAPLLEQYAEQLAVLNHKGFCNQRKNLNLLQRHNGDLVLTLQKLQKPPRGGNKSSNH